MSTKLSPKMILAWVLSLGVPLLIYFIPTTELFTPTMRTFLVLSVMAILMIAFENVPTAAVTFLLPMFVYCIRCCSAGCSLVQLD